MMEACLDCMELNLEDTESEVKHREVPTEEAAVKSSGTMKKQHSGRRQAAGQCRELKKLTRGDCGSQRKLAATCRKVSPCAAVHGARETSSGKFGPREIVDRGRNWLQPAVG
jgi:hypothetical protein